VPRFSDSEVIALSMAAETEEIESENWLFEAKLKECRSSIPNLISRRQFNDRRKSVSSLCEQIHSRIANHIDGDEDHFCIDSKLIEVAVWLVGKGVRWGGRVIFTKRRTLWLLCLSRKALLRL
jgi:transposase